MDGQPLIFDRLGSVSKRLAAAVFAEFPLLIQQARMTHLSETDGLSLVISLNSPTGDDQRRIELWVDEAITPSFGFGPDHSHSAPDDAGITEFLGLLRAALNDQLLIAIDMGGTHDGHAAWLDTRDPFALLSELASPYSPGSLRLKSFSGAGDRTVNANDLDIQLRPSAT